MEHRIFVAMPLDQPGRRALQRAVSRYRAELAPDGVRWIPPENWHLTIRFIGQTPVAAIPDVANAVAGAASPHRVVDTALSHLGAFPRRRPVVVAATLADSRQLQGLVGSVRDALEQAGFGRDSKPFRAHVTIGRFRGRRPRTMPPMSVEGAVVLRRLVVYRSETLPQGARYTELHNIPLEDTK